MQSTKLNSLQTVEGEEVFFDRFGTENCRRWDCSTICEEEWAPDGNSNGSFYRIISLNDAVISVDATARYTVIRISI